MAAAKAYSLLCKKENAHEDPIYCCAWTKIMPTGDSNEKAKDYIVTAGLDGISKVWEIKNNKLELLHVLKGHSMAIVSVAISPDGYTLATTSLDSILIIWELSTGNKVHEIETGSIDTWKVAFSPDGTKSKDSKYIASGTVDGNICIFDETQGKLIHTVEAHTKDVRSIEFSPNSKLVVTASNDGFVKLFNVASGDLQGSLELKTWVLHVGFSPDGACIAAGTGDGEVVIASTSGLKILKTFQDHSHIVWGVQFNSSSEKVVSVSKDKSINIYECPKLQTNKK
ncbi:WD repeat-containing protein 61-like isoform X2 [Pieris napi]|uniref:WD repeat-containing protein 61-like isoform X2 n=1 Tax=Pieris napi TaxID=78633 RepID=UPI001FBB3FFA|nr:WD repeat-containing protein 61-like isoform X2 [Pieris napi]